MVTIPGQFNGPPRSGNGGWVCGLLAEEWGRRHGAGVVTSTLLQPPPLDTSLTWEEADDHELRLLTAGGAIIGTAVHGAFTDVAPSVVSLAEALAGTEAYPGFDHHSFDQCFTCGTARAPGDGLRVFTGPIAENRSGGVWEVHESFGDDDGRVTVPVTWAGMDCPGAWAADFANQALLLGRMTAEVSSAPKAGDTLVATGWLRARDGRKRLTSTALFDRSGALLGRSEQVWIALS